MDDDVPPREEVAIPVEGAAVDAHRTAPPEMAVQAAGDKTAEVAGSTEGLTPVPILDTPIGYFIMQKMMNEGAAAEGWWEISLYSDAHIVGEVRTGLGPIEILNSVPHPFAEPPQMCLVVRSEYCAWEEGPVDWGKTDTSSFHGGGMDEELAGLISLAGGVRCKSGGVIRRSREGDPAGHPEAFGHHQPALPGQKDRNPILDLPQSMNVGDEVAELIAIYPKLELNQAVSLVRAARSFATATWLAEEDPNYAWLMLVAAVEAAANERWRNEAPTEVHFEDLLPEFCAALREIGGDEAIRLAADEFLPTLKATKKFVAFLLEYLPEPPETRPESFLQVDWGKMKAHMSVIYKWRSLAVHEGLPMPPPICQPLTSMHHDSPWAERPFAPTAAEGGNWAEKDMPMNLNTFVYVAGGALRNWWRSLG